MFHPEGPTFFELTRQALSSTERGYDLLARKFDQTPFRTPDSLLDAAAPFIGSPGGIDSALDLCCGTGAAMNMLRPLCRERVVGVDFSLGMLRQARQARQALATDDESAKLHFIRADVLDLAFGAKSRRREASGSFDVVTCFGALGHIVGRDQRRLVQVVASALRPGGRFVFPSAERPPPWSLRLWLSLAFNGVIAVRNTLWRPPFVMYYLSFLLPRAQQLLEAGGFSVEIHRGVDPEYPWVDLVVARNSR